MKLMILSVALMTILTGCGVEWFPDDATSSTPVSITTTTLADAPTGLSYSQKLTARGGSGTYTWSVASGALPDGLTLSSASGTISGTPTVLTTAAPTTTLEYKFTIKVTDSATTPATATGDLSILTPTTERMYDSTGKVYAQDLIFVINQGVSLNVTNTDSVAHTIQVVVANYDTTGIEFPNSAFNMALSSNPVPSQGTSLATGSSLNQYNVNNWRIKSVTIR